MVRKGIRQCRLHSTAAYALSRGVDCLAIECLSGFLAGHQVREVPGADVKLVW